MAITLPVRRRIGHGRDDLREVLKEIAFKKGAVAFGIASADDADALPRVKIGWVMNRFSVPVRETMPDARSVVVFGVPSLDDSDELEIVRGKGEFSYPGYLPISIIMRDLIQALRARGYKARFPSVYSSHKRIAVLAGIGSYGKNALVISQKHGPWLRFGTVLTDAYIEPNMPSRRDPCRKCDRCVRACPTKALKPYVVDPGKCLVGATSLPRIPANVRRLMDRHEPPITPKARVMCRMCQLVCPYTSAERRRNVVKAPRQPPRRRPGRA
ncbi:MAG: 4Fe-4S double cluster binding domain-containing protein [Thermoplasmata archaeon]